MSKLQVMALITPDLFWSAARFYCYSMIEKTKTEKIMNRLIWNFAIGIQTFSSFFLEISFLWRDLPCPKRSPRMLFTSWQCLNLGLQPNLGVCRYEPSPDLTESSSKLNVLNQLTDHLYPDFTILKKTIALPFPNKATLDMHLLTIEERQQVFCHH